MYRDSLNLMVSETSPYPGSIGDSCANTARSQVLNPKQTTCLQSFFTDTGCVRHPTAPDGWRESDFSGDQLLPLYLASDDETKLRLRKRFPTRSGNGNFLAPVVWSAMRELHLLTNFFLFLQALLFMLPYRWSDHEGLKWYQRLEKTEGSSADYLNWFIVCVYLKRMNKLYFNIDIDEVSHKVFDYYANEPNNVEVLQDYEVGFQLFEEA